MTDPKRGHRERLRRRYMQAGLAGFSDREALELLLFYAIPRRDTKAIAVRLLSEFGSLAQVLRQPPELLARVEGIGPSASILLSMVCHLASRAKRPVEGTQVLKSPDAVREYLRSSLGAQRRERLIALLLDSSNRLLATKVVDYGTVNQASVYPRNLVEKVVSTGATAVILVHNHPGGRLEPSRRDVELTERMRELGRSLDFEVLDHLVVTDRGTVSLRETGRI